MRKWRSTAHDPMMIARPKDGKAGILHGMAIQTAKLRTKLNFRPRILLTLQCFVHNFKGSIFQIHSKMDLEIPRTRFRRLYKNISDPGDSEFLGRRNRSQKANRREEACTE